MTHCHQCRADAIGMLGEDRSQQFTRLPDPDSLPDWLPILHQRAELHASLATQGESDADDACLVAVASRHGEVIDCHFGHADRFSIYSLSAAGMVLVGERFTPKYCRGEEECEPQENEGQTGGAAGAARRRESGVLRAYRPYAMAATGIAGH